jgi:glutathione S-transferase
MKRFYYPHRFSLRREDDEGIKNMARSLVLNYLEVMDSRLAKAGPYILGARFSLADFYLSFWTAVIDPQVMRKRFSAIANLYDLVKSRPSATKYLEGSEQVGAIFGRV